MKIEYKLKSGEKVPGVTSVIGFNMGWNKQALLWWANQEGLAGRSHRDTAQKACDVGTVAHYLINRDLTKREPQLAIELPDATEEIISKAETCFLNYLDWKALRSLEVFEYEKSLISERYKFGGTPDYVVLANGKLALLDLKTGDIYEDHLIQLCAYKVLWEENHPDMLITGGFHLLRVLKGDVGGFDHKHREFIGDAWEAFLHFLELHSLHKKLKKLI